MAECWRKALRWTWGVALAMLATTALEACAPSTKTVALVSVGNTGCPAEDLAVFSYKRDVRSWRAACGDKLYVCSDIRGATECNPQQGCVVAALGNKQFESGPLEVVHLVKRAEMRNEGE